MFQLVCVAGNRRGAAYSVNAEDLNVGRDLGCEIVLPDPLVSRRHCRIFLVETELWIEDLGSRNPAMVNGIPLQKQQLRLGDEVTVGAHRFLVVQTPLCTADFEDGEDGISQETWSWEDAKPVALDADSVSPPRQLRPKTIEDLMALYKAAHEFAWATTMSELLEALCHQLEERLNPAQFWLGRVGAGDEISSRLVPHVRAADWTSAPGAAMQQAVTENRALLIPGSRRQDGKKVVVTTIVAPILAGGRASGIVALQTETPRGVYDERDLEFLVLLARQLAPALSAVEVYEQLRHDNERLRARAGDTLELVGTSRTASELRRQIDTAARSDLSVLICGETGTGKDLCARLLHAASKRSSGPWVAVNCAALPRELFESEVFGYEKGAFTGAQVRHEGLMVQANGGTIFLDEVGDLSLENQARILRCAEDGSFRLLGAKGEVRVDVRIIAATNRSLRDAVAEGRFRQDLYHRLAGFEIAIPPLREHASDIPVLAQYFFEQNRHLAMVSLKGFTPEALQALKEHAWPGNVRELRLCVQRAVTVARGTSVGVEDLWLHTSPLAEGTSSVPLVSLAEAEKRHLSEVIQACEGDIVRAAKILGVGRSTLYRKLASFNMQV
ncbi:MAG: sigma 54-interacting transcriptional regulator [Candidatus Hydrogenedentales bacterium]|jgi:DNA-binding NtrC family response regulator